jgi:hypothetical protein
MLKVSAAPAGQIDLPTGAAGTPNIDEIKADFNISNESKTPVDLSENDSHDFRLLKNVSGPRAGLTGPVWDWLLAAGKGNEGRGREAKGKRKAREWKGKGRDGGGEGKWIGEDERL